MGCEAVLDSGKLTIYLKGKCSHEIWTEPKKLFKAGDHGISKCEVNFAKASFLDSSGIGSLLALREKLGADVQIELTYTNEVVQEIIKIANIDRLFKLV
ncbi:MAG: STAS domain-containing protein [Magnetococcales bacterium]|nr:STAS domain-containing protein [Magnetococcales bacterium]